MVFEDAMSAADLESVVNLKKMEKSPSSSVRCSINSQQQDQQTECEVVKDTSGSKSSGGSGNVTPFSITDILTRMENNKDLANGAISSVGGVFNRKSENSSDTDDAKSEFDSYSTLQKRLDLSVTVSKPQLHSNQSPMDLTKESSDQNISVSKVSSKDSVKYMHNNNTLSANNNLLTSLINHKAHLKSSQNFPEFSPSKLLSSVGDINIRDLSSLTMPQRSTVGLHGQHSDAASFIEQQLQQARLEAFGMSGLQANRHKSLVCKSSRIDSNDVSSTVPNSTSDSFSRSVSPSSNTGSLEDMDASDREEEGNGEVKRNPCEVITSSDQRRDSEERGEEVQNQMQS